MGPKIDPKFNDLLDSLGRIASKNAKPVIDSIMRWRRSQNDQVSDNILRTHNTNSSYAIGRVTRPQEIAAALNERKSLASIYIMCRALIVVIAGLSRDALGEAVGHNLEETTFDQFKRPDLKLLAQSTNHRLNADLYAVLLGKLSRLRFVAHSMGGFLRLSSFYKVYERHGSFLERIRPCRTWPDTERHGREIREFSALLEAYSNQRLASRIIRGRSRIFGIPFKIV